MAQRNQAKVHCNNQKDASATLNISQMEEAENRINLEAYLWKFSDLPPATPKSFDPAYLIHSKVIQSFL